MKKIKMIKFEMISYLMAASICFSICFFGAMYPKYGLVVETSWGNTQREDSIEYYEKGEITFSSHLFPKAAEKMNEKRQKAKSNGLWKKTSRKKNNRNSNKSSDKNSQRVIENIERKRKN